MEKICSVDGCGGKHYAKNLCNKHYKAQRWALNPEIDKAQKAKWRAANREKERARTKAWRDANPEKVREKERLRWVNGDREKQRAKSRINGAKWAALNPEKVADNLRRYRARSTQHLYSSYVKHATGLSKDAPEEVIEVYRIIIQIRRELRK